MSEFGLLTTGFNRKRLSNIRDSLVAGFHAAYGENAKTDSDSPDGHQIDIMATEFSTAWEAMEDAYLAAYVSSSSGSSLDLAVEDIGIKRLGADPTTAAVVVYGTSTTAVLLGSIVETVDNGDGFTLDAEVVIGTTTDVYVVEIPDLVVGETHTITIDGTPFSYMAAGPDTVADVRDELVTLVAVSYTANSGGTKPGGGAILVIQGVTGLTVTTTGDTPANTVLFDADLGAVTEQADESPVGVPALATTINTIVSTITDWEGVANILDGDQGRATESDAALRARFRLLQEGLGTATPDSTEDRLVLEVDDVDAARVFENVTEVVVDGRPPHSFETVTLGGLTPAVAQKIWDLKPSGVQTFGDLATGVVNSRGKARVVNHSLATEIYAHLLITVTKGEGFPQTPEADLATQVATDVAAYGDANLSLGDDLYRIALNPTIIASLGGSVTAASDIVITTGTTPLPTDPTPALSAADLPADEEEIVRLDTTRISVVFV